MTSNDDRLEREINEILDKIEQFPTPERRRQRALRRQWRRFGEAAAERQRAAAREISRFSLSQVVLVGFLLILGSFLFRGLGLGQWVLFAGLALLIASGALLLFGGGRRRSAPPSQQWRGRTISYDSDSPVARIRRWLASRRSR